MIMSDPEKNILVIDDDARNIFALAAVLKSRKYKCVTATTTQEGLKILSERADIAVVLLDMMMPEIDGYEAIPKIRNARNRIPIISVTAQAMAGDREKCLAAGADNYISKPIDIDLLLALLHQYIGRV